MKRIGIFLLVALMAGAAFSQDRVRVHTCVIDGLLTAARQRVAETPLGNPVGALQEFSTDMRRVGGGGAGWNCASWTMPRTGLSDVSFELLVQAVFEELNMKVNTGVPNVQAVWYLHCDSQMFARGHCVPDVSDDYGVMISPGQGFDLALADLIKKPWALEEVPFEDPDG